MNESQPKFEGQESSEQIPTDEQVIKALEVGFDNPETMELYNRWYDAQQREADRIGTNLARMNCAVNRAVVYYKAGYINEAVTDLIETLDGVINVNEGGDDVEKLKSEIEELLNKMKNGEML